MVFKMAENVFEFLVMQSDVKSAIQSRNDDQNTDRIKEIFDRYNGSESEKKTAVDQAFRDTMKALLYQSDSLQNGGASQGDVVCVNGESKSPIFDRQSLISYCISCANCKFCTHHLPVLILGDVFDTLTLDKCEVMFSFVESHVSTWTSEPFFTSGKNHLLRMCNDLLRRLSKIQDTIFCGRIQLFLAQLFPIEEKSALNLVSNFHLDNSTVYKKSMADFKIEQDETMDTEDGELISSSSPVDYNLYVKFWSLQDFFRNPPSCYVNVGWRIMSSNLNEVLKVFSSHKLEAVHRKRKHADSSEQKPDLTLHDIMKNDESTQRYFAKYLTNEKLMDLQLNDSNFRRYFLVQVLVLFQYLTGTVKFKQPTQVLTEPQSAWVKEITEKVYSLLEETPPSGKEFAETVQHILNREENWTNWKNEGCPSFARSVDPIVIEEGEDVSDKVIPAKKPRQRRSVGTDYLSSKSRTKINMGTVELTRLWNICPDNLEASKQESRLKFLPTVEDFFEEAIEQADPEAGIEDEYKLVKDASFCWRALRLLARRSHHFFTPSQAPFKALPEYLSNVVDQLGKDLAKPQQDLLIKEEKVDEEVMQEQTT